MKRSLFWLHSITVVLLVVGLSCAPAAEASLLSSADYLGSGAVSMPLSAAQPASAAQPQIGRPAAQFIFILDESTLARDFNLPDATPNYRDTLLNLFGFLRQYMIMFPDSPAISAAVVVYGGNSAVKLDLGGQGQPWLNFKDDPLTNPNIDSRLSVGGYVDQQIDNRCDRIGGCFTANVSRMDEVSLRVQELIANPIVPGARTSLFFIGSGLDCRVPCTQSSIYDSASLVTMNNNLQAAFPTTLFNGVTISYHLLLTRNPYFNYRQNLPFWGRAAHIVDPYSNNNAPALADYLGAYLLDFMSDSLYDPYNPADVQRLSISQTIVTLTSTSPQTIPAAEINVPALARTTRMLSAHLPSANNANPLQLGARRPDGGNLQFNASSADGTVTRLLSGTFRASSLPVRTPVDGWDIQNPPPGAYFAFRAAAQPAYQNQNSQLYQRDWVFVQTRLAKWQVTYNAGNLFQYYPITVNLSFIDGAASPDLAGNAIAAYTVIYSVELCRADGGTPSNCLPPPSNVPPRPPAFLTTVDGGHTYTAALYPERSAAAGEYLLRFRAEMPVNGTRVNIPIEQPHLPIADINPVEILVDCQVDQFTESGPNLRDPRILLLIIVQSPNGVPLPDRWEEVLAFGEWHNAQGFPLGTLNRAAQPSHTYSGNTTYHIEFSILMGNDRLIQADLNTGNLRLPDGGQFEIRPFPGNTGGRANPMSGGLGCEYRM